MAKTRLSFEYEDGTQHIVTVTSGDRMVVHRGEIEKDSRLYLEQLAYQVATRTGIVKDESIEDWRFKIVDFDVVSDDEDADPEA